MSERVLRCTISRALDAHKRTNCLTGVLKGALASARDRDWSLTEGVAPGPLHGIPVSIKECYEIEGEDVTCGLAKLCGVPCTATEALISALVDAGAVPFCRSNLPQTMLSFGSAPLSLFLIFSLSLPFFLLLFLIIFPFLHPPSASSSTEYRAPTPPISVEELISRHPTLSCSNPIYGNTSNPHDGSRTCGGSSGGEAALIACGGSVLGLGSDVGGSLRVPAAWCGIVALKPTTARISMKVCTAHRLSSTDRLVLESP